MSGKKSSSAGGSGGEWQLDLAKKGLRDEDAKATCLQKLAARKDDGGLPELLSFQEVDLSENHISWRSCDAIIDLCLACEDLRVVKFSRNELCDKATPALCRLLRQCRTIEQLHLSYNKLTDEGVASIVTARQQGQIPGSASDRLPLWMRVERNHVREPGTLLQELKERPRRTVPEASLGACEALDANKCGPRSCQHSALVHLPYFSRQSVSSSVPRNGEMAESSKAAESQPASSSTATSVTQSGSTPSAAAGSTTSAGDQGSNAHPVRSPSRTQSPEAQRKEVAQRSRSRDRKAEKEKEKERKQSKAEKERDKTEKDRDRDRERDRERERERDRRKRDEAEKEHERKQHDQRKRRRSHSSSSKESKARKQAKQRTESRQQRASDRNQRDDRGSSRTERVPDRTSRNEGSGRSRVESRRDSERDRSSRKEVGKESSKEGKDSKEVKEGKEGKEGKDGKDKDGNEAKEAKETKESKEVKEKKEGKESKEAKESKEEREAKEKAKSSRWGPPLEEAAESSSGVPGIEQAAAKAARLASSPWLAAQAAWNAEAAAAAQVAAVLASTPATPTPDVAAAAERQAARKTAMAAARRAAPPPPWLAAKAVFNKNTEASSSTEPGSATGASGAQAASSPAAPQETPSAASEGPAKKKKLDLKDISEISRTLSEERNKLRLFVIKAKQDYEESKERKGPGGGETDKDEYFNASPGDTLGPDGDRFSVEAHIGRGVFSSVYHVKDAKDNNHEYAIKFIRRNKMMRKAAEKEVEMYRRLQKDAPREDAEGSRFLINLAGVSTFEHNGHLCLVFELLKCDMRLALQRYGQGGGLPLPSVAQYTRQILLGLRVLRRLKVIHADLKPDNLLMTMSKAEVQLCDFGSAMDATEQVKTPYAQPRYYRAPDIILGIPYDTQIDVWSAGATIFELATGKILFTGKTNNQMLKQMLEVCGGFPKRMISEGEFARKHFNSDLNFVSKDPDSITGVETIAVTPETKPARPITSLLQAALLTPAGGVPAPVHERWAGQLAELVTKCLTLDPTERIEPAQALELPFFKKEK